MALDFDFNDLSETSKACINGIPFLAGMVQDVPTPYYTKLLQAVITFCVIGIIGWSAAIVIQNKENGHQLNSKLDIVLLKIDTYQSQIAENKAEIKILKEVGTKDRVYRPEWERKYQEQDARLLHLERAVK